GDVAAIATLAKLLATWRSAAFSDEAGLVLAERGAVTLGVLGAAAAAAHDAPAVEAARGGLRDTAHDPAFPQIQAARGAGLGALGPACDAGARAALVDLSRSDQPGVGVAAKRALATCGK